MTELLPRRQKLALTVLLGVSLYGCDNADYDSPPAVADTPEFLVPASYRPDAGRRTLTGVRIKASEFGFHLSARELAGAVEGFEQVHFGLEQDLYVIVFPEAPSLKEQYRQQNPDYGKGRANIWYRSGGMAHACVADRPDAVTGYVRYYTYCDPEPGVNSNFFLLDRRPDASQPPPDSRDFVKGICRDWLSAIRSGGRRHYVTDEVDEYIGCIVSRRYNEEVLFQYRLRGNNLVYMNEVTNYINSLLASWKRPLNGSQE